MTPDMTPEHGPDAKDGPKEARPHDMGGEEAGEEAGAIDTADHGLLFWEKQANGMRMVMVRKGIVTLDELRRGAEDLEDYYQLSYFERATKAIRNILLEKRVFTDAELDAKMAQVRARFEVEPQERGRLE